MSDVPLLEGPQPAEERPPPRGRPLLAWGVILGVAALVVWSQQRRPVAEPVKESIHRLQPKASEQLVLWTVGLKELGLPFSEEQARQQITPIDQGPYRQRLEAAILASELLGPREALDHLARLKQAQQNDEQAPSAQEQRLWKSLWRLYTSYRERNYTGNVLSDEEKENLRDELGWSGELALVPAQGPDEQARERVVGRARRFVIGVVIAVVTALSLLLLGFVALVVLLVLLFNGKLQRGFVPGSPHGGIYAETFALWLVLFVGFTVLGALLPSSRSHLVQINLLQLLSLVALAWPVWRGVPWNQVRLDAGLYGGCGPVREAASGLVCYVAAVPLLLGGLIVMLVLMQLQKRLGGEGGEPTHPIVGLAGGDWWVRLQIVIAASVAAPIIEETMFRGVFYRHLREATRRWGFAASFLVSGLVNSFLFAAIHPQGLLAVPALMGLALGFTLAREWRGTLVPCMIAHGLSNGLVTLLLFTALS